MSAASLSDSLPDLWLDWCVVTGHHPHTLDDAVLTSFAQTAGPSRAVLNTLHRLLKPIAATKQAHAPAWPAHLHSDAVSLQNLLQQITTSVQLAGTDWQHRLRLRRLAALAVFIAPISHGGAALSRSEIQQLTPPQIAQILDALPVHDDPPQCSRCVIDAWLSIISLNRHWSRSAIREEQTILNPTELQEHHHQRAHHETDWQLWPEEASLMPAIDRWGYLEHHQSLHPSSISVMIRHITDLSRTKLCEPATATPTMPENDNTPALHLSADREAEILAEADAVQARMNRIFAALSA